MKKLVIILLLISFSPSIAQENEKLTFDIVKPKLLEFLYRKGTIDLEQYKKMKNKEHMFNFGGLLNYTREGELKEGVYIFSTLSSHSQLYYVIIENNDYEILQFNSRTELDDTLSKLLSFCERKKYCVEITKEIVISVIDTYYKYNRYPLNRIDVNCEKGVINKDDLP